MSTSTCVSRRRIRSLAAWGVAIALFFAVRRADAYPWMIEHGYTGCATCHADPSGAGLLTAYGRAQSELLLSTRWSGNDPEAEPSRFSQSLFGVLVPPDALLVGGWLRGGHIWNEANGHLVDRRFLLMRADAAAQVTIGKFRASGSLGLATSDSRAYYQAAALTRSPDGVGVVSREHWIGFDVTDAVLVRGGRLDLPFGIRNIEHTAWVRSETRTDINQGQQHGVAISYSGARLRGEAMAILGNYQLRPDAYRERGAVGYLEWAPTEHLAAGVSALATHSAHDDWRQTYGVFARVSPWRPLAFLVEADMPIEHGDVGAIGFLQADIQPVQGLHFALTGEALRRTDLQAGGWATVSWFFLPHFDARADVILRSGARTYLLQLQSYL